MLTFADGKYQINEQDLPPATVHRMLQTATNHILGNEVASSVVSRIKQAIAGKTGKAADVTTEQVKTYRADESHASQIAGWEHELRQEKIQAMVNGTLTVRAGGPSRDPHEQAQRMIAKLEVQTLLKASGAKFPGKDETVEIPTASGDVVNLTGDELIERRLAHPEHGPRIVKEAERKVAADKRLKDNVAKAGGQLADLA